MKFQATVQLDGKTATGIEVPPEVVSALGSGKRPKVRVTVNGYTYRSSVGSMGGRFKIPVSAEARAGAGISAGDAVEVEIEPDTEPRTVTVPAELAAALAADPDAQRAFGALSYSGQQRHVLSVEGAKTAETRQRRIARIISDLRQGKR